MDYIKRLLVAELIVLPLTALVVSAVALTIGIYPRDYVLAALYGEALAFVLLFGGLTAAPASLLHTYLSRRWITSLSMDVLASAVMGGAVGAVTPTVFTGLAHPPVIAAGACAGVIHSLLVRRLVPHSGARGKRATARARLVSES